jgi:hypothetical protein
MAFLLFHLIFLLFYNLELPPSAAIPSPSTAVRHHTGEKKTKPRLLKEKDNKYIK